MSKIQFILPVLIFFLGFGPVWADDDCPGNMIKTITAKGEASGWYPTSGTEALEICGKAKEECLQKNFQAMADFATECMDYCNAAYCGYYVTGDPNNETCANVTDGHWANSYMCLVESATLAVCHCHGVYTPY